MDFSELIARAPWNDPQRPPASLHGEILGTFLAALAAGRVPIRLPGAGPFAVGADSHLWPEVFLQVCGERHFTCPSGGFTLGPGEMAVIPRGTRHRERPADRGRGHACLVAMCFRGSLNLHVSRVVVGNDQFGIGFDTYDDGDGAGVDRLADEVELLHRSGEPGLPAAVETLLRRMRRCAAGRSLDHGGHPPLVDRCLRMLASRLYRPDLGVAFLAAALDCHPDHLGKVFRQATGETLVGHIARRRVDLAAEILADGRANVRSAALAVGFADPAYFSRVFRRMRGMSPQALLTGPMPGPERKAPTLGSAPPVQGRTPARTP